MQAQCSLMKSPEPQGDAWAQARVLCLEATDSQHRGRRRPISKDRPNRGGCRSHLAVCVNRQLASSAIGGARRRCGPGESFGYAVTRLRTIKVPIRWVDTAESFSLAVERVGGEGRSNGTLALGECECKADNTKALGENTRENYGPSVGQREAWLIWPELKRKPLWSAVLWPAERGLNEMRSGETLEICLGGVDWLRLDGLTIPAQEPPNRETVLTDQKWTSAVWYGAARVLVNRTPKAD
ncbi:hypothetical protein GE21DRAFT_1354963 [Neurospora crassa]|nr:hypothetical protein GE21DRAFT_1354963 [Neurospora crassa]